MVVCADPAAGAKLFAGVCASAVLASIALATLIAALANQSVGLALLGMMLMVMVIGCALLAPYLAAQRVLELEQRLSESELVPGRVYGELAYRTRDGIWTAFEVAIEGRIDRLTLQHRGDLTGMVEEETMVFVHPRLPDEVYLQVIYARVPAP